MGFTVPMALVDFLPVIFFAVAAVLLQRDLYPLMPKGAYSLMACGQIDIICAGGLKALYKLLYAANICDFQVLNTLFFPLQTLGFLFAGLGVLGFLQYKGGKFEELGHKIVGVDKEAVEKVHGETLRSLGLGAFAVSTLAYGAANFTAGHVLLSAPPVVSGTMFFVVIMVLGMALVCIGLSYFAAKIHKPSASVLFVFAFIFSLCMGYLSSRDFSQAYMNWAAEVVNTLGQGCLLLGTIMIHKIVKNRA